MLMDMYTYVYIHNIHKFTAIMILILMMMSYQAILLEEIPRRLRLDFEEARGD